MGFVLRGEPMFVSFQVFFLPNAKKPLSNRSLGTSAEKTMTKRNRYDRNEDGRQFHCAQVCTREVPVVLMTRISATPLQALGPALRTEDKRGWPGKHESLDTSVAENGEEREKKRSDIGVSGILTGLHVTQFTPPGKLKFKSAVM